MTIFDDAKIASFSQVSTMKSRVGKNKSATEGACHNFSLQWIADILGNTAGSASERMARLSKNSGGANLILQKMFGDRWQLEGASGADMLITQIHGLATKDVFAYKNYFEGEMLPGLKSCVGLGAIYSFWFNGSVVGAEGGGHSVAFYSTMHGGKLTIHFFDPNFGEFLIQSDEFVGFWHLLTSCYGPMQSHCMRQCTKTKAMTLGGR